MDAPFTWWAAIDIARSEIFISKISKRKVIEEKFSQLKKI